MSYSGSRALVTGGLGFIGSHLAAALLERGAEVMVVDSMIPEYGGNTFNVREIADRIDIQYTDIRDPWAIRRLVQGHDFIFNLAGQVSHIDSMADPMTDLEINGRAQLSLLEALRENNPDARIVFAASRQQYGRPQFLPVTEEHPLLPVDVNGINLVAGERYHLLYSEAYGLRASSLRLTNTYGPHLLMKHDRQGLITTFIRRSLEGKTIHVFGDGSQLRDFTYVEDAVEAFLATAATEATYGRALNLGGTRPIPLLEVAELCQEIAGMGGAIETVPWPEERKRIDIGSVHLDHSPITDLTGWAPRTDMREGLQETIDFYRENRAHYWSENRAHYWS